DFTRNRQLTFPVPMLFILLVMAAACVGACFSFLVPVLPLPRTSRQRAEDALKSVTSSISIIFAGAVSSLLVTTNAERSVNIARITVLRDSLNGFMTELRMHSMLIQMEPRLAETVEPRVEAHIFVCFLAYCLHVTLKQRLSALASGLTPRAVLETLAGVQMLDVEVPTTDGRWLVMSRYTQPEKAVALLLARLKMKLPDQPPPRLSAQKRLMT
ncbi:MAG: hypothetical protein AABZ09_06470, partial [Candidatus Binatota bacterium]